MTTHQNAPIVYPGSFRPPIPWRNGNHRGNNASIIPIYTMSRSANMIIFKCWIPGVRREDIQLFLRNHRIHLHVCTSLPYPLDKQYDVVRYQLEYLLPSDAETAWYAAEYRNGLLTLQFPVSRPTVENGTIQVVVY